MGVVTQAVSGQLSSIFTLKEGPGQYSDIVLFVVCSVGVVAHAVGRQVSSIFALNQSPTQYPDCF